MRLYAGCMQVVCRFTKPIPMRLYAGITLFSINYFVIKKLYIKDICKKSVTSVTTNTSAGYRGVTESVTNCNKCNRRLEAGYNCLYLKFRAFFSIFFC